MISFLFIKEKNEIDEFTKEKTYKMKTIDLLDEIQTEKSKEIL